jgi:hypothetical protein
MAALAGHVRASRAVLPARCAGLHYLPGVRDFVEDRLGVPMLIVVFAPVLTWLGINLRTWPTAIRVAVSLIAFGAVFNGLAIAANGRMPYLGTCAVVVVVMRRGRREESAAPQTPTQVGGS